MRLNHATKPFGVSLYHLGFGDMLEFIDPSWGFVPSLFFTMIYIYTYIHTYIHTYITLHYIALHCIALHYITLHYIHTHYIQVNQGINKDKPTSEIP